MKASKPQKQQKYNNYSSSTTNYGNYYNLYGTSTTSYGPSLPKNTYGKGVQNEEEETKAPVFKLVTAPKDLDQLEIVWNMALETENPKVVPKAIDFLIKVYSCLDEDMMNHRITI